MHSVKVIKEVGLVVRSIIWSIKKQIVQSRQELLRKDTVSYIRYLNSLGMQIDEDVIISSPETLNIDIGHPTLISVKGGGLFCIRI